MKRICLLFVALFPFILTSCEPKDRFTNLQPGEKVVLTSENVRSYLKLSLPEPTLSKDKQGSITSIKYKLVTKGYAELTYFIDVISCTISYSYLGDNGEKADGGINISVNPAKDGKSSQSGIFYCNYRSVSNFHLANFVVEGSVNKKL